jgi:hypothetical protein
VLRLFRWYYEHNYGCIRKRKLQKTACELATSTSQSACRMNRSQGRSAVGKIGWIEKSNVTVENPFFLFRIRRRQNVSYRCLIQTLTTVLSVDFIAISMYELRSNTSRWMNSARSGNSPWWIFEQWLFRHDSLPGPLWLIWRQVFCPAYANYIQQIFCQRCWKSYNAMTRSSRPRYTNRDGYTGIMQRFWVQNTKTYVISRKVENTFKYNSNKQINKAK